jgi:hypothetical protein
MSQPDEPTTARSNGIASLRARREERVKRQPPPPRHPRTKVPEHAPEAAGEPVPPRQTEISREITPEISHGPIESNDSSTPGPAVLADQMPSPTAARTTDPPRSLAVRNGPPDLHIDVDDPSALAVTPTVLSIAGPIMRRFETARASATSHTVLVLDALRTHVHELPELVLAARPAAPTGDLFPWRSAPGAGRTRRPEPLRIRPTAGELRVIDALATWVNTELTRRRPGISKASRSEVVAAALNAYLPKR